MGNDATNENENEVSEKKTTRKTTWNENQIQRSVNG